jgi:ATP-binding cassette, subfamily F, member 3
LFVGDDVEKKVSVLSGGERSRLALARMLCGGGSSKIGNASAISPPSLILFDEPTNHLDMGSREHLAAVLSDYDGSLVVISHDRFFLDGFINKVWEVEAGAITEYTGDYSDYEWAKSKDTANVEVSLVTAKDPSSAKLNREKKKKEAEERNQRYKNLKPLQTRLAKVESRLEVLMQTNETLQSRLADTSIYEADQKSRLLGALEEQIILKAEEKNLIQEWDNLTVAIEKIDSLAKSNFSEI